MAASYSALTLSLNDLLKYKASDLTEDELWCLLYGACCALQRSLKTKQGGPGCLLITPDTWLLTDSGTVEFSEQPPPGLSQQSTAAATFAADAEELEDYLPPEVPSLAQLSQLLSASPGGEAPSPRSLEMVLLFSLGVTMSAAKAVALLESTSDDLDTLIASLCAEVESRQVLDANFFVNSCLDFKPHLQRICAPTLSALYASVVLDSHQQLADFQTGSSTKIYQGPIPSYSDFLVSAIDHKLYLPDKSSRINNSDRQLMTMYDYACALADGALNGIGGYCYRISIDYGVNTTAKHGSQGAQTNRQLVKVEKQSQTQQIESKLAESGVQCAIALDTTEEVRLDRVPVPSLSTIPDQHPSVEAHVVTTKTATVDEATEPSVQEQPSRPATLDAITETVDLPVPIPNSELLQSSPLQLPSLLPPLPMSQSPKASPSMRRRLPTLPQTQQAMPQPQQLSSSVAVGTETNNIEIMYDVGDGHLDLAHTSELQTEADAIAGFDDEFSSAKFTAHQGNAPTPVTLLTSSATATAGSSKSPLRLSRDQGKLDKEVRVHLPTGERLALTCSANTLGGELVRSVCAYVNSGIDHLLGLAMVVDGEARFLLDDIRMAKQAPKDWLGKSSRSASLGRSGGSGGADGGGGGAGRGGILLQLTLRLKFYPESVDSVPSGSRRLLYLLLRRAVLDSTLPAGEGAVMQLAGLALHHELGSAPPAADDSDPAAAAAFRIEQYLPKCMLEQQQSVASGSGEVSDLSAKLVAEWRRISSQLTARGSRAISGRQFCSVAMSLPHYSFHLFALAPADASSTSAAAAAAGSGAGPLLLGVSQRGLLVARALGETGSRRRHPACPPLHRLAWQDAEKVSFKRAKLVVASTTSLRVNGRELGRLQFQLGSAKLGKYLAALCSQLHDWSGRLRASWPELGASPSVASADVGVQRWASQTLATGSGKGQWQQQQQQRLVASGPARAESSAAVQPPSRQNLLQPGATTVRVRSMLSRLGRDGFDEAFVRGDDIDDDINFVSAATDSSGLNHLQIAGYVSNGGADATISSGSASYSSGGVGAEAEAEDDDAASSARRRRQDRPPTRQRRRRSRRHDRGAGASGSLGDIYSRTPVDHQGSASDTDEMENQKAAEVSSAYGLVRPAPPLRPPPPQMTTSVTPTKLTTPAASGGGRRWASNPTLPTFSVTPASGGFGGDDDGGSSEGTASTQDTIIVKTRHQLELDRKTSQLSRVSSGAGGVRDLLPGDKFKVTLRKKDDSFGFYVWGGTNTSLEGGAIYVKSIAKGGAADLDARIRVNDKIIWVNSVSLERVTHKVAMETLLSAPEISVFHLERGQPTQPPGPPPPPDSPTTTEDGGDSFGISSGGGVGGIGVGSPDSSLLDSASVLAGRKRLKEAFPQLSSYCDCLPVSVYKNESGSVGIQVSGGYHPGNSAVTGGSVSSDDGVLGGTSALRHFGRIKRVLEHSHESVQRLLSDGDLLLEIADQPVYGRSHAEIVAMLRAAASPIRLYIARPRVPLLLSPEPTDEAAANRDSLRLSSSIDEDSLIDRMARRLAEIDAKEAPGLVETVLYKDEVGGGGLGFLVSGGQDTTGGCYIRSIVRDPALSDGVLRPGDRLLAVNDIDVSRMRHDDCVEALRAAPRRVRIRVLREFEPAPTDDEELAEEDEAAAEAGDSFSDDSDQGVAVGITGRAPYLPQSVAAYSVSLPLPREADGSRPLPLQLGDLPSGGVCVLAVLPSAAGESLASVRIGDRLLRIGPYDLSTGANTHQVNELLSLCGHLDEIDLTLTRGSLGLPGSGGGTRISEETEVESLTSRDDADTTIMESSGIFAPEELAEAGVIVDEGEAPLQVSALAAAPSATTIDGASAPASGRSTPTADGQRLPAGQLLLSAAPLSELGQAEVDAIGLHRPRLCAGSIYAATLTSTATANSTARRTLARLEALAGSAQRLGAEFAQVESEVDSEVDLLGDGDIGPTTVTLGGARRLQRGYQAMLAPSDDSTERREFWRRVLDSGCGVLWLLASIREADSLWPRRPGDEISYGEGKDELSVQLIESRNYRDFALRCLRIRRSGGRLPARLFVVLPIAGDGAVDFSSPLPSVDGVRLRAAAAALAAAAACAWQLSSALPGGGAGGRTLTTHSPPLLVSLSATATERRGGRRRLDGLAAVCLALTHLVAALEAGAQMNVDGDGDGDADGESATRPLISVPELMQSIVSQTGAIVRIQQYRLLYAASCRLFSQLSGIA